MYLAFGGPCFPSGQLLGCEKRSRLHNAVVFFLLLLTTSQILFEPRLPLFFIRHRLVDESGEGPQTNSFSDPCAVGPVKGVVSRQHPRYLEPLRSGVPRADVDSGENALPPFRFPRTRFEDCRIDPGVGVGFGEKGHPPCHRMSFAYRTKFKRHLRTIRLETTCEYPNNRRQPAT